MLLASPVVLALVAALARGGSLRHLAALPLRGSLFILCSLALQVALYLPTVQRSWVAVHWGGEIYVLALALALVGALCNWRLGMAVRLATLGLALNALVIVVNGGSMPVNRAALRAAQGLARVHEVADAGLYGNTRLATQEGKLLAFSDVLPLRVPHGPGNVFSLGDILIVLGVATLTYRETRGRIGATQRAAPGTRTRCRLDSCPTGDRVP